VEFTDAEVVDTSLRYCTVFIGHTSFVRGEFTAAMRFALILAQNYLIGKHDF